MSTFQSVSEMFLVRVAETPDRDAFMYPTATGWGRYTWKESGERVKQIACGLRALGLADEQRAAVLCSTRVEWIFCDLGILCAGGATTTIYPSSTQEDCVHILTDSGTRFAFVENAEQVKKLSEVRAQIPAVEKLIVIDGAGSADGWVLTLDDLMSKGRAHDAQHAGQYDTIARSPKPTSLATLIYTSGTTGKPKGVELPHACWVYEGETVAKSGLVTADDLQYLWLPLAHSFGKVLEAVQIRLGFCTAVDGRVDKIVENLGAVRPTFVAAVPRIFEKVYNKVVQGAKDGGGAKYAIFKWAVEVGKEGSKEIQAGRTPGGLLGLKLKIADKLVYSKLKERFGGRIRVFVSGSAPLSRDIAEFFHACGILILEGYGLTESSAGTFVNRPHAYRFGTVGQVFEGTELKIAEDGEILMRGPGIMRGYHNLPEATAEALDAEGWLHTGDIGVVHPGGFLQITDRKKDLIKTSGGKYVAPQSIEGKLKVVCPLISQVVVHGDNRNFCVALLTLDEEAIKKWAGDNGLGALGYAELTQHAQVRETIKGFMKELNQSLANYEQLKDFAILPQDLTLEAGELTPSLKVKRKAVEKKHAALLEKFYAGSTEKV